MAAHATLSPSSAERWINCPASVQLVRDLADQLPVATPSQYADQGTAAHSLAELEAAKHFGIGTSYDHSVMYRTWRSQMDALTIETDEDDMRRHVAGYVALLEERMARHPHSALLLEQRVQTGIDGCWGTGDAIIVSPTHVEIVDFKYGQGVAVDAENNPQLRLYGVGSLETFGDLLGEPETVYMTIYQPRVGSTSTASMTAADLIAWRDAIRPIAAEALSGSTRFGPSESACRWCPAAGACRARVEKMTAEDFGKPPLLSPEELGEVLARLPDIRQWLKDVEEYALHTAYSNATPIPGWKVVLSGGRRVVTDTAAAIQTLIDAGYPAERVARFSLLGIGELEKVLKGSPTVDGGKPPTVEDVLGDLVTKTPGRPSLVPENDRREAIDPATEAKKEFK